LQNIERKNAYYEYFDRRLKAPHFEYLSEVIWGLLKTPRSKKLVKLNINENGVCESRITH